MRGLLSLCFLEWGAEFDGAQPALCVGAEAAPTWVAVENPPHASLSQIPAEFRSRSQLGSAFAFALETMPMAANMVMMEEPP